MCGMSGKNCQTVSAWRSRASSDTNQDYETVYLVQSETQWCDCRCGDRSVITIHCHKVYLSGQQWPMHSLEFCAQGPSCTGRQDADNKRSRIVVKASKSWAACAVLDFWVTFVPTDFITFPVLRPVGVSGAPVLDTYGCISTPNILQWFGSCVSTYCNVSRLR